MKTCAIIYGITEGPWHARRMRQEIAKRGWKYISEPSKADIIIAHSGGVFFIGKPKKHQTVLLIDPTCPADNHPHKHVRKFIAWEFRNTALSKEFPNWMWRMIHNVYYTAAHFPRNREIARRFREHSIAPVLQHPRTYIVQSANHGWYDGPTLRKQAEPRHIDVVFVNSHHDDCWNNPGRYLDLIP